MKEEKFLLVSFSKKERVTELKIIEMAFLKRLLLLTIFLLSLFFLLKYLLLLSQETSTIYKLDSFQYRVINFYKPQKVGIPIIHIFLKNFKENSRMRNIEFVQKFQKHYEVDSLYKMEWIERDKGILDSLPIYKFRFYERNLKDENSDNSSIGTIGVDLRKDSTMCLCFTSCSFVSHDTCFYYK